VHADYGPVMLFKIEENALILESVYRHAGESLNHISHTDTPLMYEEWDIFNFLNGVLGLNTLG
jgi:hypothetical protein